MTCAPQGPAAAGRREGSAPHPAGPSPLPACPSAEREAAADLPGRSAGPEGNKREVAALSHWGDVLEGYEGRSVRVRLLIRVLVIHFALQGFCIKRRTNK